MSTICTLCKESYMLENGTCVKSCEQGLVKVLKSIN